MKILVVDDEASMRDAYRQVLAPPKPGGTRDTVSQLANDLFGEEEAEIAPGNGFPIFDVRYASQGEEAVALVEEALALGQPFKVIFLDIRMPPGIDGRETARRIRAIDSQVNIVIVTAYSDHSVTDIAASAGPPDKIFYISKPFAADEVRQMATALCRRWDFDTGQIELLHRKMAELVASEARASHAATHDFLTGAPNRRAFFHELTKLAAGDRTLFSVALIDLDRFKYVNDTFGHGAGDELLIAIYDLLRSTLPQGSFVARMGGDEFGLILNEGRRDEAERICNELVEACSRSFSIYGSSVRIGASCGLLIAGNYPRREMMELVRGADLALFAAKEGGRGITCLFDKAMDEGQRSRREIEEGLRGAIEREELAVHYQPIVDHDTLVTVGFEALLRWQSPDFGPVPPSVFIPIAEESQLIDELGEWVLDRALRDSRSWPGLFVSVNFSPRQFRRPDFLDWLDSRVGHWGADPSEVQIEVTETAIFEDAERAAEQLRNIETRGYRIALDDFGTGYSSLFNIKNFALSCVKIDKSFVDGLGEDRQSKAIIASIVHLAKALGLKVVAEGVESEAQCKMLRVIGCSQMQGFLFGQAEPAEQAVALLAASNVQTPPIDRGLH